MSHLVAEACIPHKSSLITSHREVVAEETVVGLILRTYIGTHLAISQSRLGVQYYYACHRVGSVHQRGRTFQYLYRSNAATVDLNAMFVAPLLTFLSHSFAHHHYSVIAQSTDDGFGYAASSGKLAYSRLMCNGIDDVGRCCSTQYLWCYYAHRCCGVFQLGIACYACNCELVELQMAEEYVGRILRMIMFRILCCHRCA